MPLEDLLAFYGYEPVLPAVVEPSANSSPSDLADELPDMTLDKVSAAPGRQAGSCRWLVPGSRSRTQRRPHF